MVPSEKVAASVSRSLPDAAVAVLTLLPPLCVHFLAFFDTFSVQPHELALDLQSALHLGHIFSWLSKIFPYSGLALQFHV